MFVLGGKTNNRVAIWLESKLGVQLSPLPSYYIIMYLGILLSLAKGYRKLKLKRKERRKERGKEVKVTEFQLCSLATILAPVEPFPVECTAQYFSSLNYIFFFFRKIEKID